MSDATHEPSDATRPYTRERLEVLKVAVPSLIESLGRARVYPGMSSASGVTDVLVFEIELTDPTAGKFADLIFHGNEEAMSVNLYTALLGLTWALPRSVCTLCRSLREKEAVDEWHH